MPSRNITKVQVPESYYHVYARGSNKQKIFLENADYKYFLGLFERYLSKTPATDKLGTPYPHYLHHIEIVAYCLMTNHFHLLLYQQDIPYLEKFMRSLMTSYSRYFNLKYRRTGPVFESRYKAVRIDQDLYLQHITRYIHLNPRLWKRYRYSSLRYYRDGVEPYWLHTKNILELFASRQEYMEFVADYEELHDMLSELKYQLADQ
jgi:putative transposase